MYLFIFMLCSKYTKTPTKKWQSFISVFAQLTIMNKLQDASISQKIFNNLLCILKLLLIFTVDYVKLVILKRQYSREACESSNSCDWRFKENQQITKRNIALELSITNTIVWRSLRFLLLHLMVLMWIILPRDFPLIISVSISGLLKIPMLL